MFREVQRQTTVKCWISHILIILRKAVNCSIWMIHWFNLWITKRVFEPKTKRRKPLETLGFGNFGGFSKYKVQKTSPSLIWWIHCDSSILTHRTKTIIGTHWDGSMTKLREFIVLFFQFLLVSLFSLIFYSHILFDYTQTSDINTLLLLYLTITL